MFINDLQKLPLLLLFFTVIFCTTFAFSQGINVIATTDTNEIKIGEQFSLKISVIAPSNYTFKFPMLSDSINSFELISLSKIDTTDNKNNSFTYTQTAQLTQFDSGIYVIQPITFLFKDLKSAFFDSISSEAILMKVSTIAVDTTKNLKDIKGPVDVPITLKEILPYLLIALAVIVAGYFLFRHLKSRKKTPYTIIPKKPAIPPHETALLELKKLAEEKLWQQGLTKQYHTRLTDVLRAYIEGRFSIHALEETTDEILIQFKNSLVTDEAKEKLSIILHLADLVKFAKAQPIGSENENSLSFAREFVLLTKPVTESDFNIQEEKS
jgi:hypothetical protein